MKFKQAIAYRTPAHVAAWMRSQLSDAYTEDHMLATYMHSDPKGSSRLEYGLSLVNADEPLIDLNGHGLLLAVQFNERILPASVRDSHARALAEKLEAAEGRKPGKKELAMLRDQAEAELLPVSHIKRTVVPMILSNDGLLFVFTSSTKRAGEAVAVLWAVVPEMDAARIATKADVPTGLTNIARDIEGVLTPVSGGVLRGPQGETVRIKDVAIERDVVQDMLDNQYSVHELDLIWNEDGHEQASFNVNRDLVIRRFKVSGALRTEAKGEQAKLDMVTDAWLTLKVMRTALSVLLHELGGEQVIHFAKDDEL